MAREGGPEVLAASALTAAMVLATVLTPSASAKHPDPPAASSDAIPLAPVDVLTVVYRDAWPSFEVALLGVDAARNRAVLQLRAKPGSPYTYVTEHRLVLDTVDLLRGVRTERWAATPEKARAFLTGWGFSFYPLTGTFEADLARYARLLRPLEPVARSERAWSPVLEVSPDGAHILCNTLPTDGTDGDWLWIADAAGRRVGRLDEGLLASYAPVFSPDGRRVAWKGCKKGDPRGERCKYHLFLAELGRPPIMVRTVVDPVAPLWGPRGEWIYTVTRHGEHREGGWRVAKYCLVRVAAAEPSSSARVLRCEKDLPEWHLVIDPDGATAVLTGRRGPPGDHVAETTWLSLPDGKVLGRLTIPRGGVGRELWRDGIYITGRPGDLIVADIRRGVLRRVPGMLLSGRTSGWLADGRLVLMRQHHEVMGRLEIMILDVPAALR